MIWKNVKLGDFLKRSKIPIDIVDNKEYKRVTIRIKHQGVSIRDTTKGIKIGTKKQFVLKQGQFILSKIDARYGAFGLASKEVDNAIITGNFWAYDVDTKIVSIDWINKYTNSSEFYELCERASSGITHRKYLDEIFFLNHEIKIPSPIYQRDVILKINYRNELIDYLKSETSRQLVFLKKLKQQILQDAVQGKLVKQDQKDEPASVLLKKIKAEKERKFNEKKIYFKTKIAKDENLIEKWKIPSSWTWVNIGSICDLMTGATPSTKNQTYFRECLKTIVIKMIVGLFR